MGAGGRRQANAFDEALGGYPEAGALRPGACQCLCSRAAAGPDARAPASGKRLFFRARRQESVRLIASRWTPAFTASRTANRHPALEENSMRDLIFILLTLAIFAVFALIAKGVERL